MKYFNILISILLLVILSSCVEVVETTRKFKETTKIKTSCRTPGICYNFYPGHDGNMTGGFKYSNNCPGSRNSIVDIYTITTLYDDGSTTTHEEREIIDNISECKI